ncbi:MAG: cytochrome c [Gemmatimonadota bacterium]
MRKTVLSLLVLAISGCNFWYNEVPSPDDFMHAVPWFDHMILSQAVHPYERLDIPRNTPPGIVPVTGAEANWGTPKLDGPIPLYGFDTTAANAATRPVGMIALPAARGEELFTTYCAACHGQGGAGNSTVSRVAPAMNPPLLTSARVGAFSDGYIYSMVRYGRNLMPPYGDKIVRQDERWAVVDYIRSLQPRSNP